MRATDSAPKTRCCGARRCCRPPSTLRTTASRTGSQPAHHHDERLVQACRARHLGFEPEIGMEGVRLVARIEPKKCAPCSRASWAVIASVRKARFAARPATCATSTSCTTRSSTPTARSSGVRVRARCHAAPACRANHPRDRQGYRSRAGERFFRSLVLEAGSSVGHGVTEPPEVSVAQPQRLTTLAICADGRIADNFDYASQGTPCVQALEEGHCLYSHSVREPLQGRSRACTLRRRELPVRAAGIRLGTRARLAGGDAR